MLVIYKITNIQNLTNKNSTYKSLFYHFIRNNMFAVHNIASYFSLSVILQVLVLCAGYVLASCLSALKQGFKSPRLTHRWQSRDSVANCLSRKYSLRHCVGKIHFHRLLRTNVPLDSTAKS